MIEAIIFAWLLVYIFPVESLVTYFNVYMKLEVTVWVTYSNIYTKLEVIARGCLLEETKLDFFYSSWKQLNCFCFRLIFLQEIFQFFFYLWVTHRKSDDELTYLPGVSFVGKTTMSRFMARKQSSGGIL